MSASAARADRVFDRRVYFCSCLREKMAEDCGTFSANRRERISVTKRLLAALALFTLVLLALGTTVASAQTVTIGNTFSAASCNTAYAVQTANSAYVVPAGNWRVTSWSTQAGAGGSMSLMIFRPTATPGTFTVVGESPVESLTANSLNTFTLASPIAVQPGDLLGLWSTGANCAGGVGGVVPFDFVSTPPPVGATLTPPFTQAPLDLNISAVLSPALPTAKDECKDGGWQSFGVFKNQGDCVSFVATGGKNPPAG
jgi:hypothetical protein